MNNIKPLEKEVELELRKAKALNTVMKTILAPLTKEEEEGRPINPDPWDDDELRGFGPGFRIGE